MDEHSKNSLPNTPSINVRDSQLIDDISKITFEAFSKEYKKAMGHDNETSQGIEAEGQVPLFF